MKKAFISFCCLFLVSLIACSTDSVSSAMEERQKIFDEQNKRIKTRDSLQNIQNQINSVTAGLSTRVDFENAVTTSYYTRNLSIEGIRVGNVVDTSIEVNGFVSGVSIRIPFADKALCNFSNTQFLLDGKPLKGDVVGDTAYVAKSFMESYGDPHRIEILFDSVNCKNIREQYTIVPSKCPGRLLRPEVNFSPDFLSSFKKYELYVKVFPDYYWPEYFVYGDTVNSKCFLKTPLDSLRLKLTFEPHDLFEKKYPSAWAIADEIELASFMAGDSVAMLKCTLAYQSWIVSQNPAHESYTTKIIRFREDGSAGTKAWYDSMMAADFDGGK